MTTIIDEIQKHAQRIREGQEKVSPGMPLAFTEASTANDAIWQGDLCLVISEQQVPPIDFVPYEKGTQLVPGNTEGARHCLDTIDGVEIYVPRNWNDESLTGPFLVVKKECSVLHPVHGTVTIPAGFNVECYYQREYDKEMERERRAKD